MRGHAEEALIEAVGFLGQPRTHERVSLMRAVVMLPVTLGRACRGSLVQSRAELSIRTSQRLLLRHTHAEGRVRVD